MLGLRLAARRLASTPGFTLVAILTIALAIAANTAIYSLVDAVLFRPLPFNDPEALLQIWTAHSETFETPYVRTDALSRWCDQREVFAACEPYQFRAATLLGAGEPDILPTSEVGGGLMQMLGVPPLVGRPILPADGRPGAAAVAVIGELLWRSRFGADARAIGRRIRLDDDTYEIVGVMPSRFRFPRASHQVWIPLRQFAPVPRPVQAVVRLRPGVTPEVAEQRLRATTPADLRASGSRARLHVFGEKRTEPAARRALYILLGSVIVVLLIACANFASLMLVRGTVRLREVAVRKSMGASRASLAWPLLAEALLITLTATALGAVLATWFVEPLARLSPSDVVRLSYSEIAVDLRVVAFTAASAVLTGTLVGILPALQTSRVDVGEMLRTSAARATAPHQQRFRQIVVTVELGVSIALLIAAGLLMRSFVSVSGVDPGFETERVLTVDLTVPRRAARTQQAQQAMFAEMLRRIRAVSGVERAELSGGVPPGGGGIFGLQVQTDDGRVLNDDETPLAMTDVGPDYFAALGLTLREGRAFTPEECGHASDLMIISEGLARRLWPAGRATGHRFRLEDNGPWYTVVGVARDVFQFQYNTGPSFAAYYPADERLPMMRTVVIRAAGNPAALRQMVRAQIRAVDPEQPVAQIATAAELYQSLLAPSKFYASLMSAFAGLAALLAIVGLYGLTVYMTALRGREFSIRIALGAEPRRIMSLVLRQGFGLAAAGATFGVLVSLAAGRLLESLLVGVRPTNLATYAVVVTATFAVTVMACWFPARRAGAVDPAITLRAE